MFSDKLVQKLTGTGIDDLVFQLHEARARVFDLAEKAKSDPKAKAALEEARIAYAIADATLEKAKAEHAGLVALTQLLAAMTQAGKDTNPVRLAMARLLQDGPAQPASVKTEEPAQPAPAQSQAQPPASGQDVETGTFTVLEARPGKSPGTVRAYCQAADGNKVAVYAKNGDGQTLARAVGKAVTVKYRQGDKGLIAVSVSLAG